MHSTIAYACNAMIHLDSRMLDLWLLMKDHTIVIIWGENTGGENGERGGEVAGGRGENLYTHKTSSWKVIIKKLKITFVLQKSKDKTIAIEQWLHIKK